MDKIRPGLKTLFLSHQNADPDAIGSLYFLQKRYGGDVVLPNSPDRKGKPLAEYLNLRYKLPPLTEDYEQYVVVDTPTPTQLDPISIPLEKAVIIDHHPTDGWEVEVHKEKRTSCVEIIYDMVAPEKLSKDEGIALIAGMITDTSGFRRATVDTFRTLADIIELSGASISEVYDTISSRRTYSEKICRLKGAERSLHVRESGLLIAYTYVSSFESSVSDMLLRTGADISFSGSQRDENFLISSRVRNDIIKMGVDMGQLFNELAKEFDNVSGGGHPGAAVLKGKGEVEEFTERLVRRTRAMIKERDISIRIQ